MALKKKEEGQEPTKGAVLICQKMGEESMPGLSPGCAWGNPTKQGKPRCTKCGELGHQEYKGSKESPPGKRSLLAERKEESGKTGKKKR